MRKLTTSDSDNQVPKKKIDNFVSFVLAILPIFTPYASIQSIPFNVSLIIICCIVLLLNNAKIQLKRVKSIWFLWFSHAALSIMATLVTHYNMSLINSLAVGTISALGIGYMWSNSSFNNFIVHANRIGIFASLFLFIQAISLSFGMNPPSGRIPWLSLLDYSSFLETTWGFRLNSIFQEPSYFAIYILPLFVYNLKARKGVKSLIFFLAIILSTSSLGIISAFFIIVLFAWNEKINVFYIISLVGSVILVHLLLTNFSEFYSVSLYRSFDKMSNIFMDSEIRLNGQVYLFEYLPTINKFIGVGINQLQNYFMFKFNGVANYSNSFIVTLVNTGLIGILIYFSFILYIWKKVIRKGMFDYVVIFILIASVDYFIYNYFFYYILTYIFINNNFLEGDKL
jgi:hypothetical protein